MRMLEERIDAAHRAGDKRTLERLQAEYRARGPVVRVTGLPIAVVEPGPKGGALCLTS